MRSLRIGLTPSRSNAIFPRALSSTEGASSRFRAGGLPGTLWIGTKPAEVLIVVAPSTDVVVVVSSTTVVKTVLVVVIVVLSSKYSVVVTTSVSWAAIVVLMTVTSGYVVRVTALGVFVMIGKLITLLVAVMVDALVFVLEGTILRDLGPYLITQELVEDVEAWLNAGAIRFMHTSTMSEGNIPIVR